MAILSQNEIAALAQQVGLSASAARIASAIAMAESSGNTHAHNPRPPDDSYGLWQINMINKLGPERRAKFGLSRNEELFDPAVNARAMYSISSGGTNWNPWTTYTSGRYKSYLSGSETGTPAGTTPLPGSSGTTVQGTTSQVSLPLIIVIVVGLVLLLR